MVKHLNGRIHRGSEIERLLFLHVKTEVDWWSTGSNQTGRIQKLAFEVVMLINLLIK